MKNQLFICCNRIWSKWPLINFLFIYPCMVLFRMKPISFLFTVCTLFRCSMYLQSKRKKKTTKNLFNFLLTPSSLWHARAWFCKPKETININSNNKTRGMKKISKILCTSLRQHSITYSLSLSPSISHPCRFCMLFFVQLFHLMVYVTPCAMVEDACGRL